jgi:hypothetical protein
MDRPFIYVFDADALTNGLTYNDLMVPLHKDSQFLLRRISGLPTVVAAPGAGAAGRIQVRSDERKQLFSAPAVITPDQAVVPELAYAPGSAITFDLINVLRAGNATTGTAVFFSQLCFQGVRRFPEGGRTPADTAYRYQEKPFAIVADLIVNWSGRLFPGEVVMADSRQFNAPVQDFDFELHYITMVQQRAGGAVAPCNQSIKMMLYDVDGNQLMSAPVCDFFLSANGVGYNSLFPAPPLVYPAGSQILFDLMSLLSNAMQPMALEVVFGGVRRMPC